MNTHIHRNKIPEVSQISVSLFEYRPGDLCEMCKLNDKQ